MLPHAECSLASRFAVASLLVILLLAMAPRFYGLGEQGFFTFDEARYLLEASAVARSVERAVSGAEGATAPQVYEGMARPLHVFFLAIVRRVDVALLVMAIVGLASVVVVGLIARGLVREEGDRGLGAFLAASAILASSPSHVFLSRTILAEADAVFFFLCGLMIYQGGGGRRRRFAAGLLFGFALLTQSRMAMILPAVLFWEWAIERRFRSGLALLAGIALPVIAVELFFQYLKEIAHVKGHAEYVMTYIEQFFHRAATDEGRIAFNRSVFGIEYLVVVESLAFVAAFVGGAIVAVRRPTRFGVFLALLATWILAVATFFDQVHHSGMRWGRSVAPAVPLASALAAVGFVSLWKSPRRAARFIAIAAFVWMLVARLPLLIECAQMHSDYEEILVEASARFDAAHAPITTAFSDEPLHISYYLGPSGVRTGFRPEEDTTTVVVFDAAYAGNFGFWYLLPDTPSFTIERPHHRESRLILQERTGIAPSRMTASPRRNNDARVYNYRDTIPNYR